jgi:uncharacterized protein (TIGR00369 family)
MDETALQELLDRLFAPWVRRLGLQVRSVRDGNVVLALPVTSELVHHAGILCGQATMAAADTAMVLAISADLGEFRPMTTVQLQTSFLKPIGGDEALVTARVLRRGKTLAFGEVEIHGADGKLAAHTTTTYTLLES